MAAILAKLFYTVGWGPVGGLLRIVALGLSLFMVGRALMAWLTWTRRNNCPRCDYRLFPGSNVCVSCGFEKEDAQGS
jgi:DNA-directed RNA polymerase subunit RPC12/RpoP